MRHPSLLAGLSALALLALPACSDDGAPDSTAAVVPGDPAACPGEVLDVVASVAAWGGVVQRLGGDCATVTTITGSAADLSPADRAVVAAADLVVVNGIRYDEAAIEAAEAASGDPVVVSAAEVVGRAAQRRDPHLWYEPAAVPEVSAAIARQLADLSPDAAPYFDAQHTAWTAELQPVLAAVAALRDEAAGRTYAATRPLYGRTAEAVGLVDETPRGFLRSMRSGTDPSPDDVAAFESLLRDGAVEVLIQDGAGEGDVPEQLREAADDGDVPVVAVTEGPPDDVPFVEWQLEQLTSLAEALAEDG
ncbi:metal ABC transporter solute-binding protein, Zn/Mn family [Blastococcus goldschmidtiae]|uniref:Zinc ABC transporter substrate-binding protein n=1 Tax=Blastococcus goldschmidtiae TaxID=3075546 RepID=A0ABU2K397_9ACTN|nr:zinc ABC transporter substrate-binding protein [Blastococcus sp. DSM 46792]MDT0274661.1 zinc ABC transporter substrate-binding protein [Blastococcus sp. DSM 46792]